MAIFVDKTTGNLELYQGDSGYIKISGIPTNKNYHVFFSIYNSKGKIIGDEVDIYSYQADTVVLFIPSSLTDLLVVKGGIDSTETYYYGVKLCDEETGVEDTQNINEANVGELNTITVHPKKTEGIKG